MSWTYLIKCKDFQGAQKTTTIIKAQLVWINKNTQKRFHCFVLQYKNHSCQLIEVTVTRQLTTKTTCTSLKPKTISEQTPEQTPKDISRHSSLKTENNPNKGHSPKLRHKKYASPGTAVFAFLLPKRDALGARYCYNQIAVGQNLLVPFWGWLPPYYSALRVFWMFAKAPGFWTTSKSPTRPTSRPIKPIGQWCVQGPSLRQRLRPPSRLGRFGRGAKILVWPPLLEAF